MEEDDWCEAIDLPMGVDTRKGDGGNGTRIRVCDSGVCDDNVEICDGVLSFKSGDGGCWVGLGRAVDFDDDEDAIFAFRECVQRACACWVSNGSNHGMTWACEVDLKETFPDAWRVGQHHCTN